LSSREKNKSVCEHVFPDAGVYIIEQDGLTSIAESVEHFFPDLDMDDSTERTLAFEEYSEILTETGYLPIPEKLC
jgi:hypothetical protein